MNTSGRTILSFTRRLSSTVAPAHLPHHYQKKSFPELITKTLLNPSDPRTFPRFAVLTTSFAFFGLMSFNFFRNRAHHLTSENKNNISSPERSAVPNQMTKVMKNGPIIMNAQRYKTIQGQEGLGVDHDAWLNGKQATQLPKIH